MMKLNISTVLRNTIEFSKVKYRTYHKFINSVCVVPFVVLNSFELIDVPLNLMITLAVIYVIVLTFKLLYHGSETLKNVIYSCTIKGHPISSLFWIIIGGIISMMIVSANDKRQMQQDKEEYELAYTQFQGVILGDIAYLGFDSRDFATAYGYLKANNDSKALEYLKKVSKNCAFAEYLYGRMLYSGAGCRSDVYEAIKHFEKAAEKEVFEAKYDLMVHYLNNGDFDTAEGYGLDIMNKLSLGLPPLISSKPDHAQLILDEVTLPIIKLQSKAYASLLDYYWISGQYEKAIAISEIGFEYACGGGLFQYEINKALSMYMGGDRLGAKRYFRKIIRRKEKGESGRAIIVNYYVENLLMPSGKDISLRNSKEAEKLLIENIRNGNQTSVSLLKELYERCGYERQAIEMAHLESYNEIVRDHERE